MIKNLPIFLIIAPLFTAVLLPVFAKRVKVVEFLVILVGVFSLAGAISLAVNMLYFNGQPTVYSLGGWKAPWGIELKVNSLSAFLMLFISGISLPISIFGVRNLSHELGNPKNIARFYTLYLLLVGALSAMAFTNDLFNVFVLVEVATLSCCGLVSTKNSPQAAKAAFSYLILASIGSTMILAGIGLIYILTGHLNMSFANEQLVKVWQDYPQVVWGAFSFMLVGFGIKVAIFPLHIWLPDAHSNAPTPASAILSALAIKGYFICFLKILYNVFGTDLMYNLLFQKIIIILGMVAIIAGSLQAIIQDELKRRLAYSTAAQMGYLFIGLGLASERGLTGLLLYMAGHGVCKALLFLSSGAIIKRTGKTKVSELSGIGRKMPITMAAFTLGTLGLVGLPLFSGFIGKWNLLVASLQGGEWLAAIVIVLGSVLCAIYLLPIIKRAYFEPQIKDNISDVHLPQKVSLIMLMVLAIVLGFFPKELLDLAQKAATELQLFI